ncbi:MAG TPA: IS481 family transposase [Acidimicrobiia bacterium]|nr:IS481 family transposase [Acidimicrobiia bacterium]
MSWRECDRVSERLEFVRLAESGAVSFAELCRRFGVSRPTGYQWLGRWRAEGEAGLADRSRRPAHSPSCTDAVMERRVVKLRKRHPRWGGRKISRVLVNQGHRRVPAPSTITGILRRHRLLSPVAPPRGYVSWQRPSPNDLWQMDFKGWFGLSSGQRCHPFGVLDDHSRYNLCLAACADETTATVKALLEATFGVYGIPNQILCDNGSPWGNDLHHPWTPLGVWLLDVGVGVIHPRPYHPQTDGKQERFHLSLDWEVISTRPAWDDHPGVQAAFDTWRVVYNHQRPHDALGLDVPADHYQPSARPYPRVIEPPDYPQDYQVRSVSADARISFHNRPIRVGRAFIGRRVGITPTTTDGTYDVYYRHQHIRTINLATP